jgi:hypothetical protein
MKARKQNKIKALQRQKLSRRQLIAAGISVLMLTAGIVLYLQFSQSTSSVAEVPQTLSQDKLPVEMAVAEMAKVTVDTNFRNGSRYKIAKSLTLMPGSNQ